MILLFQRVKQAKVIYGDVSEEIGRGLLIYVGFEKKDDESVLEKSVKKILNLRIFEDEKGKMNLSVLDIKGDVLIVPNFTLAGDAKKGNRPSFDNAMDPENANRMFLTLVEELGKYVNVKKGGFREHMEVHSVNDGPVNIVLEI